MGRTFYFHTSARPPTSQEPSQKIRRLWAKPFYSRNCWLSPYSRLLQKEMIAVNASLSPRASLDRKLAEKQTERYVHLLPSLADMHGHPLSFDRPQRHDSKK
jgi:hypothetical protein